MESAGWIVRIADSSARHAWRAVGLWALVLVIGVGLFVGLGDALRNTDSPATSFTNTPESARGAAIIEERLEQSASAQEVVVVQSDTLTVDDPAYATFVEELLVDIRALDGVVESATSTFETGDSSLVSVDGGTTLLPVNLAGNADDAHERVGDLVDLVVETSAQSDFVIATGGEASINHASIVAGEDSLTKGERIGAPIALLILIVVFGTLVAAGIPIAVALASVFISLGVAALIGQVLDLSLFVVNMIFMIGLAVGIDYALFVISRFREERALTDDKFVAIQRSAATSSRAVLFSGLTVVVALLGMMLVPSTIFKSLSLGAIIVVTVAVLAILTLLPAVLSLLDLRIERGRIRIFGRRRSDDSAPFWARVSRLVMRRPVISAVSAVALLLALALPYVRIDLGLTGVSDFPDQASPRIAFEILDEEFSAGLLAPVEIAIVAPDIASPEVAEGIDELTDILAADPAFGPSSVEVSPDNTLAVMTASLASDPESPSAHDALKELRNETIPAAFDGTDADVAVTGQTAFSRDSIELLEDSTPLVFAFVLGASFLLLLVAFRSIIIPIKSILMNLLSVGAAYGALVLVFQEGVGNELFGFPQVDNVVMFLPLFMFSILFGLSMDYHVFILSRVKERYEQTGDNEGSVAHGIRATGSVITGAALIMVAVFAGFALGDFVQLQQIGFGLAFAILLDATVVRTILLPATMRLLGDWNWYFPNWLEWVPEIDIEGSASVILPPVQPDPLPVSGD